MSRGLSRPGREVHSLLQAAGRAQEGWEGGQRAQITDSQTSQSQGPQIRGRYLRMYILLKKDDFEKKKKKKDDFGHNVEKREWG